MTDTNDSARIGAGKVGHTPGPWLMREADFDDGCTEITTDGRGNKVVPIASIDTGYTGKIGYEQEANARLIAAAPDMLEALRLAYAVLPNGRELAAVIDAIAKATGAAS